MKFPSETGIGLNLDSIAEEATTGNEETLLRKIVSLDANREVFAAKANCF